MKILNEKNTKLIGYLKDFKSLFNKINDEWQNESDKLGKEIGAKDYPFKESFDELGIPDWVDSFIKELN